MRHARSMGAALSAALVLGLLAAACDSPTEPPNDLNPALIEAAGDAAAGGFASNLPQGSGNFSGPAAMQMDAAAEEFIQQVTLRDGTVLKTSGISILAVPDEAVTSAPFKALRFGAAATGSLESVQPGTYQVPAEQPPYDFITPVDVVFASVWEDRENPNGGSITVTWADGGTVVISSVNYFDDVYTCTLSTAASLVIDTCEYQLGVVQGNIEFTATIPSGPVVQPSSAFSLPIMRRTIIAHQN